MVDRNVSATLVSISLWGSLLNFPKKKKKEKRKKEKEKKTLFLIVLHGFLETLNFLWGFAFYLLLMFCSVGVLLYICIMNLRYICKTFEIWLCYFERIKFGLG